MLTRCPNPLCLTTFKTGDDLGAKYGNCPICGQLMTIRPIALLDQIDQVAQKRAQSGLMQGGVMQPEKPPQLSALLEDIRSLFNVGSILRTADGAGIRMLYLCGITGCPPGREIAKTSLGAENHLSWQYHTGSLQAAAQLKDSGVFLLGLESPSALPCLSQSRPLKDVLADKAIRSPLCLAVGNEVTGLSAELLDACDLICHLPMRGSKESLNVAVAFGIAAYMLSDRLLVADTSAARY